MEQQNNAPAQATGILSAHPRGFGFVLAATGEEHFVPPPLMKKFVPGDIVSFETSADPATGRTAVTRLALVSRPETFWLGEWGVLRNGALGFVPDDAVHVKLLLPASHGAARGDVLQVRVPAGSPVKPELAVDVVANLGPRNDREFDTDYAMARWRLPGQWPADVAAQAAAVDPTVKLDAAGTVDMTGHPFVTIDGESTRDFDDAVCISKTGQGYRLKVAVADVSRYVPAGSPLDAEALRRGTSVYFPDRVVPMLPEVLSNGLCSLNPGELRYALVCTLDIADGGRITAYRFERAVIRSIARLTYNTVSAFLAGNGGLSGEPAVQARRLHAFYQSQKRQRDARGLLEYRSREPKLKRADDGGYTVGWEQPTVAHGIIEECMLAANRAAAAHLALNGMGMLFRHHQGVDPEKWAETRAWLAAQGIAAPEAPTLTELRGLLELARDHPLAPAIEWRVRRSFTAAVYDEALSSHYTLGFPAYTHFTSPIRRYADLVVHRLLLGEAGETGEGMAKAISSLARRAQQASRYPWDRIKRRALWQQADKAHAAQVVVMSRRGLKAVVEDWDTAAFIPAASLEKSGLAWDEGRETWVNGRSLELGELVHLRLSGLSCEGPQCELCAHLAEG